MKTIFGILVVLAAFSLPGQQKPEPRVTVTPQDVQAGSVRLISGRPEDIAHNLVFRYRLKAHDEIQAILNSHPRVQICDDRTVVVKDAGCTGYRDRTGTNLIGLALSFRTYEELKLAQKTLRGEN
jgi:hypothetical protein